MGDELTAYFNLSYRGFPMEDLTVTSFASGLGENVDLYRCRVCAALVDAPTAHANWHEGRSGE